MARSSFSGSKYPQTNTTNNTDSVKKHGVYIYVDESGNVEQIKKDIKKTKKYYPNTPSNVDNVIGDVFVIGVNGGSVGGGPLHENGATVGATKSMSIADNTEAYAKYV